MDEPVNTNMSRTPHKDAVGDHTSSRLSAPAAARLRRLAAERITIENIWPEIDGGRHPAKRVVGDVLEVWADIFCDGHDVLAACVRWHDVRVVGSVHEAPMLFVDNDRWRGAFPLERNTRYRYTIEAWRDRFASWRADFVKKRDAGQDVVAGDARVIAHELLGCRTVRQQVEDQRDPDPMAADAWLPEADVRVDRDAAEEFFPRHG